MKDAEIRVGKLVKYNGIIGVIRSVGTMGIKVQFLVPMSSTHQVKMFIEETGDFVSTQDDSMHFMFNDIINAPIRFEKVESLDVYEPPTLDKILEILDKKAVID